MRAPLLAALLALAVPALAGAATVTVINNDAAGVGFNDPTIVAPVGGNPKTTLGEQRMFAVQFAANLWGSILPSGVEIRIGASWGPLSCSATAATLAGTTTNGFFQNFIGAPLPNIQYNQALANKLNGNDLGPATNDMTITFNVDLDNATCLGATSWYYGVDGNEGTNIELIATAFHEFGHGLGFTSQLASSGAFNTGNPTVLAHFVLDNSAGLHWDQMTTNSQRAASAINTGNVVWDGPAVNAQGPVYLDHQRIVSVSAPAVIAGDYRLGVASFGADVTRPVVTAQVVLADDGTPDFSTSNGCTPLVNAVAGKIALIDRGTCTFVTKAQNAQAAGAVGVIVADTIFTAIAPDLGGSDPSITIPVVGITRTDGNTIRNQLAAGVTATIGGQHPTWLTGADLNGRVKMYAPNPFESGSSTSHFDRSPLPNLLMEPAISASISAQADLTRHAFRDMGWFDGTTITGVPPGGGGAGLRLASAPNPFDGRTTVSFRLERRGPVELEVFGVDGRRVRRLARESLDAGAHAFAWDGRDDDGHPAAAGVYLVRLQSLDGTWSGRVVRLH